MWDFQRKSQVGSQQAKHEPTAAPDAVLTAVRQAGYEASITTAALAWLLAKPTVVAPIASASKEAQVADLVAVSNVTLTPDEVARLDAVSAWNG